MTEHELPPWKRGDQDLADDVYAALVPLDGFKKGSRSGPRPYSYLDKWWVVVALTDFGDAFVKDWGLMIEVEGEENGIRRSNN